MKDPAANPVMDYSYTYDRMDNITEKATGDGNYTYGYDDLYRLSTVDNPNLADEAYAYDNVGNRLTSADTTDAWGYTANNELTGYDDVSYEYDAGGNMISKTAGAVVTNYVYNIENRLVRVEDGSSNVIAEYYYDPFGRRLWKEAAGVRTYFCYADEGLVAEFDASGNQIKSYGYRPGSTWTTDPLFMEQGGQYYFYHNDHLGTPQQMTSVSGAVVWAAEYGAFGQAQVDAGSSVVNNLRFPGQYYDEESGLHYNFHRYYDSGSGRYSRVDPIGWEGGINLYAYVHGNPLLYLDSKGLDYKECLRMKLQEKIVDKAFFWQRQRACQQAHITCQSNCNHFIDGEDCDDPKKECRYYQCVRKCQESLRKCTRKQGFKYPDMLYEIICPNEKDAIDNFETIEELRKQIKDVSNFVETPSSRGNPNTDYPDGC